MPGGRCSVGRWQRSLLTVLALAAVGGCSDDRDSTGAVGPASYSAVIEDFLPAAPADDIRPVVYVTRLGDDPFTLEDQVAIIAAVEETHDLRFVDDTAAAIDGEDSEAPPREDGLLLGIGQISPAVPHVVRVEVYEAAGLIDAHEVTLVVRDGVWQVKTSESIDPQVLLSDD